MICTLLVLAIAGGGIANADEEPAKDSQRDADRLAIDTLTKEMVQAFDKRDAAGIAAHWTEHGEFIHNDGEPIRGRADIEQGYAEFFRTLKGRPKLEIQSDAVRFPSEDMAVTEVTLRLKDDAGDIVASGRQAIVAVREGGRWKVAVIREWQRDIALDSSLKELEWLIGTWRAAAEGREVTLTYEWDKNKAFIRGKFAVQAGGKVVETGTEMIGKDHADGVIRSWFFQADGSFGEGAWTRDGKQWNVAVHGVRADGKELAATLIYVQVDPHVVTWQAVSQSLDGVPVADTPPIKVAKQTSTKQPSRSRGGAAATRAINDARQSHE